MLRVYSIFTCIYLQRKKLNEGAIALQFVPSKHLASKTYLQEQHQHGVVFQHRYSVSTLLCIKFKLVLAVKT